MNIGIVDSELNFNFRLFCKTVSNSASWGFDRFRLFNPKWHTKIQVRRPDGTILATKDFSTALSFEHDFSFDLSENTTNQEYSVYVAGVPEGAKFNQAYAWPTGYGATYGKNAEITYWDFREVNIVFSGTTGRIRFENNPITALDGLNLLLAAEVNFTNCQLDAETLADAIIGLDNSGIANGTFSYSGNLAAPAERALPAYNNLKNVKTWVMDGAVPVDAPAYEAETTSYMNAIGIPNDSTVYYATTPQETTGSALWTSIDTFVKELKSNAILTKMKAIYPFIGGTAIQHKWNLINPLDTDAAYRLTFFGSIVHDEFGMKGNVSNSYANTNAFHNAVFTLNSESFGTYQGAALMGEYNTIGCYDGTYGSHIITDFDGTQSVTRSQSIRTGGDRPRFAVMSSEAMHLINRNSSAEYRVRKRDQVLTIVKQATGLINLPMFIGARRDAGGVNYYSPHKIGFSFLADGLSIAEEDAFVILVNQLQTDLKRNA